MKNSIIILALFLMACGSRKKQVDAEQINAVQTSEVKTEQIASIVDSSLTKTDISEAFATEVLEVFKYDSAGNVTEYAKTTKSRGKKQINSVEQKSIQQASSIKIDSVGKAVLNKKGKVTKLQVSRPSILWVFAILVAIALILFRMWGLKNNG